MAINQKIFTSKQIGLSCINKNTLDRHKYQDKFTEETYRTGSGIKVALPTYYKQKIWTDQEREALRIIKEEKQVKYYNKTPIKVETIEQYKEYVNAVKYWQTIKKYDGKRKKEICKGYADLIINKEQLTRELWKTEIAIKRLENVLIRNKILIPTEAEETSETDQATCEVDRRRKSISTKLQIRRNILRNRRRRTIRQRARNPSIVTGNTMKEKDCTNLLSEE